jgi:hypothetical protein
MTMTLHSPIAYSPTPLDLRTNHKHFFFYSPLDLSLVSNGNSAARSHPLLTADLCTHPTPPHPLSSHFSSSQTLATHVHGASSLRMKPLQLQILLLSMDFSDFSRAKTRKKEEEGKKKNRKNHRPRATDDQILQNQSGTRQFLSLFFYIKEHN